jgi:glycosyltransferase involved in cell wall biosynthesis
VTRVLYSFPDTLGAPGIGTTALQQVRSLAGLGLDVHVAATALAADPGVPSTLTLSVGGRRIRHRLLGRDRAGALRAYAWHDRRVAAMLGRRGDRFDVVHCWPQATLRTAKRAAGLGIPVLRQAPSTHTAYAVERIAALHAELGIPMRVGDVHGHSAALVAREDAEYEAVDRVLVPSPYAAGTFVARGVPAERLAVHRFGCNLDVFRPAEDGRPRDRPVTVLFVGRGEPAKGLHHGLRAWADSDAAASGARLVLCGQIDDAFRRHLGPLLEDASIEERGFVADVAPLMREADVLLLPSLNEGSALVTYEAQASGCVLAVSDATGAPAEDGVHGLIHPAGDATALAGHLRRLTGDRAALAGLRANVLADRERLSWAAAAPAIAEAYRVTLSSAS